MTFAYILLALSLDLFAFPSNDLGKSYIESYQQIAVDEMNRTGIPASIKLAQGLLESDWGRSPLANNANNHFGIKCGNGWNGDEFYKEDDDFHTDGTLMQSCFRKFDSPVESYIAHSEFLTDPKKQNRYGFLFQLDNYDYKAWAYGLKQAGYATDPSYPEKLISIIEKYQLYRFDSLNTHSAVKQVAINDEKINNDKNDRIKESKIEEKNSRPNIRKKYAIEVNNNARYITTSQSTDVKSLANEVGMSTKDLITFNETLTYESDIVPTESMIYLEMKDRDYTGQVEYHKVKQGETLAQISQLYGIRLVTLQTLNRLSKNAEPLVGEKISLKKKIDAKNRPKTSRNKRSNASEKFLFEE